jgi:hypothetical protein
MMYPDQNTVQQDSGPWELVFCDAPLCEESALAVQRCAAYSDLWRVAREPGQETWLVAASRPICPGCGGILRRASLLPTQSDREQDQPAIRQRQDRYHYRQGRGRRKVWTR